MNDYAGNEEIFGAIIIVMIIAFSFMLIMYLLNALALAIMSYATFRTVSTKVYAQNYKRFSVGKSIVLTVISVVTVGLAYIVLLFIYALSNKYHYAFEYINDNLKND